MANYHPKIENLKPAKKGEVRNPKGRQKSLASSLKSIPPDMQEKVYGTLAYALSLPDLETAKKYLENQSGELGKYGVVLQIAIRQLCKDNWGFMALMDIMDRLYGKPRMSADIKTSGDGVTIVVKNTDQMEQLDNMKDLGV